MLRDDAHGLNRLANGERPRRSPGRPCRGRTRCRRSGGGSKTSCRSRDGRAVSRDQPDFGADADIAKVVGRVAIELQQVGQRRSRHLIGDLELLIQAPVELNLGDRADAEADPERRHGREVAAQARHRKVDVAVVVDARFDEGAAGADRFRIFGLQRTLLGERGTRTAQHRGQDENASSHGVGDRHQNVFLLSRRMVTGPSLTSATCIIAWNSPVATRSPLVCQFSHDIFVQRPRNLRRSGARERGAAAVARIARQA